MLHTHRPGVAVLSHDADSYEAGKPINLQLRGVDDVGIESLRIFFRKVGTPPTLQSVPFDPETPHEFFAPSSLDLSVLDPQPLDIIAIHAEARDGNTVDGPGIDESEVLLIEIPAPPGDSSDSGGGGGGAGSSSEQVNPLEMQKNIFLDTSRLSHSPSEKELKAIENEQLEALGYVVQLREEAEQFAEASGDELAMEFAIELQLATSVMKLSASKLANYHRQQAMVAQELAIASLTRAAAMVEENEPLPGEVASADEQLQITLTSPSSPSSESSSEQQEQQREELQDLLEKVEQLLAEQEGLNQETSEASENHESTSPSAESQANLGQQSSQAASQASQASQLATDSQASDATQAAAESLQAASDFQEQAADELTNKDFGEALQLGTEGEGALNDAATILSEMLEQLDRSVAESIAAPPGYAPLIENYLRSISYED